MFILAPSPAAFAQDDLSGQNQTEQTDDQQDSPKKKKKDPDAEFLQFEMNKLSLKFFIRLALNLFTVFILIRLIYFNSTKQTEFFHTFFIFNFIIFLITFLLSKVDLSLGAAFGLFAVFSILRFRTEGISTKEMTYLFLVIAVGLVNAVAKGTILEILIINGTIIFLTFILEGNWLLRVKDHSKLISYDNIELAKPENQTALIDDLKKRTGLNITRVNIEEIDFLKDSCTINVYYQDHDKK